MAKKYHTQRRKKNKNPQQEQQPQISMIAIFGCCLLIAIVMALLLF